jgi:hypothetical protein
MVPNKWAAGFLDIIVQGGCDPLVRLVVQPRYNDLALGGKNWCRNGAAVTDAGGGLIRVYLHQQLFFTISLSMY